MGNVKHLWVYYRHLAALKQRELENARVTAEEMEKQMAPLRYPPSQYLTLSSCTASVYAVFV